ncbi:MAG: thermonuclease family protein, partial [Bacteriovoracaceae bacterium]|nr:thermonuclease family protein [Bacteriovoracaceae bacterium]
PLLGLFLSWEFFTTPELPTTIVRVLDGDTLEIKGGVHVRLMGIDAPEKGQPNIAGTMDAGAFSTRCLKRLIEAHSWKMASHGRDMYGRELGEFYVGEESLSMMMVKLGCASVYPFNRDSQIRVELLKAQRRRVGLWGHGGFMRPYHYRKLKKKARFKRALKPGRQVEN